MIKGEIIIWALLQVMVPTAERREFLTHHCLSVSPRHLPKESELRPTEQEKTHLVYMKHK